MALVLRLVSDTSSSVQFDPRAPPIAAIGPPGPEGASTAVRGGGLIERGWAGPEVGKAPSG